MKGNFLRKLRPLVFQNDPNQFDRQSIENSEILPDSNIPLSHRISIGTIANVMTALWRARQKMITPEGQPLEEMKRPYRDIQSAWDLLIEMGIEVYDPINNPFDSGQEIIVKAFQPVPGLTKETVIETIKPAIYFKTTPIQLAEVYVGTPETSNKDGDNVGDNSQLTQES